MRTVSVTYGDVVGLERAEALEVGRRPQRALGHRPGTGRDVDAEPDGMRRHDDVAVEHRRVDAVAPHRLQRDLGGELGLLDGVEDRALTAHGPVLGQAAAGLAHEPHRGVAAVQSAGSPAAARRKVAARWIWRSCSGGRYPGR